MKLLKNCKYWLALVALPLMVAALATFICFRSRLSVACVTT